jgi:hypothetical protein
MKITIYFIFTTLSLSVFGQQLRFNEQLVDTIFIKSHLSAFQFDNNGTTEGKADIISISYDYNSNRYFIDRCYNDQYKWTISPRTKKLETRIYKSKIGEKVNFDLIESLLFSLSSRLNNQDLLSQVDTTKLKDILTEKQILKVAKSYDIVWKFNRSYSTKEENTQFFNGCKSIDTLKIYLSERFDTSGYVMVTDYANTIDIWISTNKTKYRYQGSFPNPVKQPWYSLSETSFLFEQAILNLKINQNLTELLPKGFLLIETISDKALVNDYISWYFERRKMKF